MVLDELTIGVGNSTHSTTNGGSIASVVDEKTWNAIKAGEEEEGFFKPWMLGVGAVVVIVGGVAYAKRTE